ncbi:unnamed protein product [Penicillium salamii]|nr:unnamed protein product [Penicillium salamii]CAG8364692.1 unnamed protein product [Penicillium salamii]
MSKDTRNSKTDPIRRFILSGKDPVSVADLKKDELKKLTDILHLGKIKSPKTEDLAKTLIKFLPKDLRRDLGHKNNGLCNGHQNFNASFIDDVLYLLKQEVGHHFRKFETYPDLMTSLDRLIVERLSGIRGMWTKRTRNDPPNPHLWTFETSGCQACMLARVATNISALRNLRTAMLSRNQTRKKHVTCRLMKLVEACINHYPNQLGEIYASSGQFAIIMKSTRKTCSKAWYNDPKHGAARRKESGHRFRRRHGESRRSEKGDKRYEEKDDTELAQMRAAYRGTVVPGPGPQLTAGHRPKERYVLQPPASQKNTDRGDERQADRKDPARGSTPSSSQTEASFPADQAKGRPQRMTQLTDFLDGRSERFSDSIYTEDSTDARYASSMSTTIDAVDEVTNMYRNLGGNPFREQNPHDSTDESDGDGEEEPVHTYTAQNLAAAMTTWSLLCNPTDLQRGSEFD